MSSYSEGFKLGYSANAPLAGISEGIQKFTQEYRKQEEIGRQRQEAYDQARSEFKKKSKKKLTESILKKTCTTIQASLISIH
mgnify:CR=1 FL=1